MSVKLPPAKLPHIALPNIRRIPSIPLVGCAPSSPTTLVGTTFGNVPDLAKVLHVRHLKKVITEQIGTLTDGKLPDVPRAIKFAERALRLASELQQLLSAATEAANAMNAEYSAALQFANSKISELNSAASEITTIPEAARTKVQQLTLDRYNQYAQELNAQIGRLEQAKVCLQ